MKRAMEGGESSSDEEMLSKRLPGLRDRQLNRYVHHTTLS